MKCKHLILNASYNEINSSILCVVVFLDKKPIGIHRIATFDEIDNITEIHSEEFKDLNFNLNSEDSFDDYLKIVQYAKEHFNNKKDIAETVVSIYDVAQYIRNTYKKNISFEDVEFIDFETFIKDHITYDLAKKYTNSKINIK